MHSRAELYERSRLRILNYLFDPAKKEFGATAREIHCMAPSERNVHFERLLAEMVGTGLLERRADQKYGNTKPYFITDAGIQYLEAARQSALFPEAGGEGQWRGRDNKPMIEAFVEILEDMPELEGVDDQRIRDVAGVLAEATARGPRSR